MNREEKAQLLAELQEMFNNSETVVISHYKGLTVAEVSKLRDDIRKAGASFRVTKNRITRLALKDTKFAALADLMTGPTAIAFANDPISACKACVEFAKANEKLIVLGGANSNGVLSVDDIKPFALVEATVFGIFIVLSVAPVMCPVASEVICETVAVPPNAGVWFAVGFPVIVVYVG